MQSLARGLSVITAFDAEHPQQTLSDVARTTKLSRAAARRFLLTLADLGYVRTDGRQFSLTPRVLDLGYAYLSGLGLPAIAQPHLDALVARTGESSSLGVLDDLDVVYAARVQASRIMAVDITVGTRFPAYVTSMGRAILAFSPVEAVRDHLARIEPHAYTAYTRTAVADIEAELQQARQRGYAVVNQELEYGLRSVAAPVRDTRGAVVAAVNISSLASRRDEEVIESTFVPALMACIAGVETDLGRR